MARDVDERMESGLDSGWAVLVAVLERIMALQAKVLIMYTA